jgi:hypothetical protein
VNPSRFPTDLSAREAATRVDIGSRLLSAALLLVTFLAVVVPFAPTMPGVGLDFSWQYAVNQAVAQGLNFGGDFVFTFGPYGSIYTKMFHPATDALMIGGSLYLAIAYWTCVMFLMRASARVWPLLLCILLAGLVRLPDPLFFCYPLLAGLAVFRLVFADDGPMLDRRWAPWLIGFVFAPLGLLPLVKGSTLLLCAAITSACFIALVIRRRPLAAFTCVAAPAITLVFFWLVAGQTLRALPGYFISMLPIVSGYTEAMAVSGNGADVLLYLLASVLILLAIAIQRKTSRSGRVFLLLIFSLYLFITFKAGFVRHDGHAMIAGVGILFAALLLQLAFSHRSVRLLIAVALCCWWQIDRQYAKTSPQGLASTVVSTYATAWRGLMHRLTGDGWLGVEYSRAIASIRAQADFPVLAGTTDIYSFDQSYLLASGNTWSPRPVFQSYSAYTSSLAEGNRQFLLGKRAPDNIIFKVEPIDNRVPSLEDGASWPVMLQRYAPFRMENDFLFLKKKSGVAKFEEPRPIASGIYRLGQRVALPQSGSPLFAQIVIKPTWLGRLAGVVFKSSRLRVELEMENGSKKQFQMISQMAESGFVISPLIEDAAEFSGLYGASGRLDGKRVTAMTMILPGRRSLFWQDRYKLTFSQIKTVESANVSTLVNFDSFDGSVSANAVDVAECQGSIDSVTHLSTTARLTAFGLLQVDGWLAVSMGKGQILADATYVVLTDAQGHRTYLRTHLLPRPDVGAYFKSPVLGNAGFSTRGDISGFKGNFSLGLAFRSAGESKICPQFNIPISIGN